MSYITGTAANFINLLDIFDSFVTSTGHCWGLKFVGEATGRLVGYLGTNASIAETITVTATSATSFSVVGSTSGNLGTATVGSLHTNAKCRFTINAGSVAFSSGEYFRFNTSPPWTRVRLEGCPLPITNRYSSWTVGNNIQNLFDDTSSQVTGIPVPSWVRIDCPYSTTVRAFSVRYGQSPGGKPLNFELQGSDDGSTWTTVHSVTNETWESDFLPKYYYPSSPVAKRFWRVNFTTATLSTMSIAGVRFYGNVTGSYAVDDNIEAHWIAPGVDGGQQINIGAYTSVSETAGYYNIAFRGFRFVDQVVQNQSVLNHEGSGSTALVLINAPIQYWIVAHGGRAIIMVRHSSQYQAAYLGYGLPYEPPGNHAYPCIIAATGDITRLPSSTDYRFANPHNPEDNGFYAFSPSNQWQEYFNQGNVGKVLPSWWFTFGAAGSPIANLDGSLPVIPCILIGYTHSWGEMDGYSWTSGGGNQPEYLMRRGQIDWISIPNISRTGGNDYGTIALD